MKKKTISIIAILAVLLIAIVYGTYSYWQVTKEQTTPGVVATACLDISLTNADEENDNGKIYLENQWPMNKEEAMSTLIGYTFKVENHCEEDVNYVIGLESREISGTSSDKYLPDSSLALSLENTYLGEYDGLANLDTISETGARNAKKIGTGTVAGNSYNTYNLKLWISNNSDVEDQGKKWAGKVFITGGQLILNDMIATEDSCFTINGSGTITGYDTNCGTSVVIPKSINGTDVKKISTNAFKTNSVVNITSLDLSKATELEEIDHFAFSNIKPTDTTEDSWKNAPKTLTNLVFGEKDHDLYIGVGAFSNMKLDNLVVYANFKHLLNKNEAYEISAQTDLSGYPTDLALFGCIAYSEIDNLKVKPTSNDKIYDFVLTGTITNIGIQNFPTISSNSVGHIDVGNGIEELADFALEIERGNPPTYTLPNSIKKIGDYNFWNYNHPVELILPNKLEYIGDYNFRGDDVETLVIPNSVTHIGDNCFNSFNGSSLTLSKNVKYFGAWVLGDYVGSNAEVIELSPNLEFMSFRALNDFIGTLKINMPYDTLLTKVDNTLGLGCHDVFTSSGCTIVE